MFGYSLILVPVLLIAVIGLGLFLRSAMGSPLGVASLSIIGLVLAGILAPSSYSVTRMIAQNMSVGGYSEYWNGWEKSAIRDDRTCYRDGSCSHTYQCDPYAVTETYTDSNGKSQTRTRTEYHSCPYSKQETDFIVKTTVDDVVIGNNVMTGEPFRWGTGIPGGQQGEPREWVEAKKRTEANKPAPATFVKKYPNFLHGTNDAAFARYEGDIQTFQEKGLLPALSKGTVGHYGSEKVYVAGGAPEDLKSRYADDVARLNGAFGKDLQGDLHVVFVPSDIGYSSTEYIETLMAYWQSSQQGKNTLSKNALLVVMGVEGDKVEWADARTGMPVGNDHLRIEIRDEMPGLALDDKLIGNPSYDIPRETIVRSDGHLESMLWGENSYQRVSMSGDDEDDNGEGFLYLKDSIIPTTGQLMVAGFLMLLLAAGITTGLSALFAAKNPDTSFGSNSRFGNGPSYGARGYGSMTGQRRHIYRRR